MTMMMCARQKGLSDVPHVGRYLNLMTQWMMKIDRGESMTRRADRGCWRWDGEGQWWLYGEIPIGTVCGLWLASCHRLTGQGEPPEPVRIRVPIEGHFAYRVADNPGSNWAFVRVDAYPIESNGVRYYVWRDSRGVLRLVERA